MQRGRIRILLAIFFPILSFGLGGSYHIFAQDPPPSEFAQTLSTTYADSLSFTLHAQSEAVLTEAQLVIQIANQTTSHLQDIAFVPANEITLEYSITPQSISLPPFAVLTYFWSLQDEQGQTYESPHQIMRYEDTLIPWQWATSTQESITIHTDGRDPALANSALSIATSSLKNSEYLTGISSQEDIHIYIYPELAQMASSLRLHGLQVGDWVAAYTIPDQRIILVSAPDTLEQSLLLERDISHEMMHAVIAIGADDQLENIPGWYNEGLALINTPAPDPTLIHILNTAKEGKQLTILSIETLCANNFSTFAPQDAAIAYAQSEAIMRYIAENHGTSQIRALFTAYTDGIPCTTGIESVLGLSLADFNKRWQTELQQDLRRNPEKISSGSILTWLTIWATSLILSLLFVSPQSSQPREIIRYTTRISISKIPEDYEG